MGARPPQGGFSVFEGIAAAPKTYVYVDGFNLFYGALKRTPYRWLDLAKLCRLYFPSDDIRKIKYFTAIVSARSSDPDQPVRQQLYLRALQTLPEVEIFYGHFLAHPVQMPLAPAPSNKPTLPSTAYLVPRGPAKRLGNEDGGKGLGREPCSPSAL